MTLLIRSLAPALAAGCTTVVKVAPQTALVSESVFRTLAGIESLPKGAVNVFTETGSAGAQALVASREVDVISYTGSTEVGKLIMAAAAPTLKRLNLELGGSAPCLLFQNADLDAAVPALVRAGMVMAGQQCVAASRLLVHRLRLDEAQARFAAALERLVVGPGDEPASEMGPMIDVASRERVRKLVQAAGDSDEVVLAGRVPEGRLARG
ncbi:MAG: aldehyde dehydrogenase family protein, partial [Betaproteobacteria bacterium]